MEARLVIYLGSMWLALDSMVKRGQRSSLEVQGFPQLLDFSFCFLLQTEKVINLELLKIYKCTHQRFITWIFAWILRLSASLARIFSSIFISNYKRESSQQQNYLYTSLDWQRNNYLFPSLCTFVAFETEPRSILLYISLRLHSTANFRQSRGPRDLSSFVSWFFITPTKNARQRKML